MSETTLNQLALDLGDVSAKLSVRYLVVRGCLELGRTVETGTLGDAVSAMAHVLAYLDLHDVHADKGKVVRHALKLLAQPTERWRFRSATLVAWASCLDEQVETRGHVFEAYPEDSRSLSCAIETERVERRDNDEDDGIRRRAEALADKSYSDGSYLIRPVADSTEHVLEAGRQYNCLASYAEKVSGGETDIWLMHRVDSPERPLVTVEVRDGSVRQAFRACNEVPLRAELS